MQTSLDCIPCFVRQALDALRLLDGREEVVQHALRRVLTVVAEMPMDQSPPFTGCLIHRIIREETGSPDPYASIKARSTQLALRLEADARERIVRAPDPFEAAVRFAIAGNVMDFAVASMWDEARIRDCFDGALAHAMDDDAISALKEAVTCAESILVLGDNAGETVFDRLLIERMPPGRVVYAVKSSAIINDATRADAEEAGLHRVAEIVENGSDAPGTLLELCSSAFRKRFDEADVVIAKGQANYETLGDAPRPVFFLTQIKCPVIARDAGREVGDWLIATQYAGVAQP